MCLNLNLRTLLLWNEKVKLRCRAKFSDASVNLYALFVCQFRPACDFFKGAQTTAAYIIAQCGRAMPDAGALGGNFFFGYWGVHETIISLDG
jgi:hypothetical protein